MKNDRTGKKGAGRPSKSGNPKVPWGEVDELLVHGEKNETGEIRYPSFRDLAKRFQISHSSVSRYSRHHNCLERREKAKKAKQVMTDFKLNELRADETALKRDDLIRAVERFLLQFEKAIIENRVRCDNPTDYNTMVRLREFLLGNAEADTGTVAGITLEQIEERYKEMQKMWDESTPEMRGQVVPMKRKSDKETIH